MFFVSSLVAPTKGNVMLSREVHPLNAALPILVTLLGIVTLVSEKQSLNAKLQILVTLSGMPSSVTNSPSRYRFPA